MMEHVRMPGKLSVNKEIYISERLQKALAASLQHTVTVVEAPTGYGKTVAVRTFCRYAGLKIKWVNVYDDNPSHAWNSLCRELFTNSTGSQWFLRWPFPEDVMQRDHFADEMSQILTDELTVLVMDDFHMIQSEQTSEFIRYLAKEFPEKLCIIIISQKQVFKDEDLLVATGKLNKITTEDLCLSRNDLCNYLKMHRLELEEEEIDRIHEKSEGWISMIYVTILNYLRMGKSDLCADMEHLVDRVAYATCKKPTQHFISYLFFLQDFTKEQADFFNHGEDCGEMLAELIENHSFFSRDPDTGLYHFHAIFRKCIYHHFEKLSLSERCIRYERMAEYMILQKDYNEALKWYEKAGNYEGILRTLELFETICGADEDPELMIRCFDNCPHILFEDYPLCLVLFMWRFFNYGQEKRLEACRNLFEKTMKQIKMAKEDKDYLWKSYYVFLSQSSFNDLDLMQKYMEKAIALPGEDLPKIDRNIPRTYGIPSILHLFYRGGSMEDMVHKLGKQLDEYSRLGIASYDGVKYLAEAERRYFTGDFEEAEIYCQKALWKCGVNGFTGLGICVRYLKAHLAYIKGDFEQVKKILDEMRTMVLHERSEKSGLSYTVDMCEAFFFQYMGYPARLADWLKRKGEIPSEIMPQARLFAVMIKMAAFLHEENYVEMLSAEDEILSMTENFPNKFTVGNIYLILASAMANLEHIKEAKAYIRKTVEMVGFEPVMFYAKWGEWLVKPLQELREEDERYKSVITACRRFLHVQKSSRKREYTGIFPILTRRENDIALLAVDGYTNKQIATQLFISENTVKSSLKNIFTKLGIKSRRDLLRIAQMGMYR